MKKKKYKYFHTFVIPSVKKSPYLIRCIKSLKKQKKKSNIIITTSKPFDGIHELKKKYNLKLKIFKKHKNIANDWNRAIQSSKSRYVTIAHQDDEYNENYFYEINKIITNINIKPSIIFTDYSEIHKNIKKTSIKIIIKKIILSMFYLRKISLSSIYLKKKLISFGSPIACPSVTYNNDFNIKFNEKFWINIDWNLWFELAKKNGSFVYIKKKLLYHRIHSKSETSISFKDGKRLKEDFLLFEKLWPKPLACIISKIYKISYRSI